MPFLPTDYKNLEKASDSPDIIFKFLKKKRIERINAGRVAFNLTPIRLLHISPVGQVSSARDQSI